MKKVFSNKLAILVFMIPTLLIYVAFAFLPVLLSGYYSLLDWNGIGQGTFTGLQNFFHLFVGNTDGFTKSVLNSFILAGMSVFIQLPLALLLALLLAYPGVRHEGFFRTVYFLPAVVSTVIIAELWKKVYNPDYGLLNSVLNLLGFGPVKGEWLSDPSTALMCVFVPIVWQYIGNHMIMLYTATKGVSDDIYEAAMIDGANYPTICLRITIPMIKPMLNVCVTFAIIGSLKAFDLIYVMTQGGPMHATEVPGTLMYQTIFTLNQYGYGSSMAIFIVAECIVFTYLVGRIMNGRKKSA